MGPRLTGEGRIGGCGGATDENTDVNDDEYDDMGDAMSDTPPTNTIAAKASTAVEPKKDARCPVCNARFKQSKNARPDCGERLAKSNLERHGQNKGREKREAEPI